MTSKNSVYPVPTSLLLRFHFPFQSHWVTSRPQTHKIFSQNLLFSLLIPNQKYHFLLAMVWMFAFCQNLLLKPITKVVVFVITATERLCHVEPSWMKLRPQYDTRMWSQRRKPTLNQKVKHPTTPSPHQTPNLDFPASRMWKTNFVIYKLPTLQYCIIAVRMD